MTAGGRAAGKIIVLGEHAVTYGHPALAAALPMELRVRAEEAATVEVPGAPDARAVEAAGILAKRLGISGARLTVEGDLPASAGLGSSAAFCVATARALAALAGRAVDAAGEIEAAAQEAERVFHGNPSGVDTHVAARGGMVLYRRGPPAEARAIRPARPLPLLIILTGKRRETSSLVERLRKALEAEPGRVGRLLERLGALAQAGAGDVESGDLPALGIRMNEAQRLLVRAGVSSPALDEAIACVVRAGAMGAKLTGAGGGGAAIALMRDPGPALDALRRRGYETRVAELA